MTIGWIVYERTGVIGSLELGRLTAADRKRAIKAARTRWPNRELHVQSEVSVAVEAGEGIEDRVPSRRAVRF